MYDKHVYHSYLAVYKGYYIVVLLYYYYTLLMLINHLHVPQYYE